jgi:hypothetical protein
MLPEQLQAQGTSAEVDARSDIFCFGLVLYEMLTGKRAFDGFSPATVIAAIRERPAPSIADVAPPELDRVLKRCLEKDPENRWQSIRDLKVGVDRTSTERWKHLTRFNRTSHVAALDCGGSARPGRGGHLVDCLPLHASCGTQAVGAAGCGFGSRRVFDRGRRVRRNHLSRRHAHCLPFSRPCLHAPAGSSERHRARYRPRSDQPVLLPGWPVDRIYREWKAEKSLGRGRLRDCIVRLRRARTPAAIGATTAMSS